MFLVVHQEMAVVYNNCTLTVIYHRHKFIAIKNIDNNLLPFSGLLFSLEFKISANLKMTTHFYYYEFLNDSKDNQVTYLSFDSIKNF